MQWAKVVLIVLLAARLGLPAANAQGPEQLPDGTVYIVYNESGGHGEDRKTAKIWGLRLRIKNAAHGIEILSQPE